MVLFVAGNLFSAAAASIDMLIVARFVTGIVQGAYFGAGAVVAAYVFGSGRAGKAFAVVMFGLTIATIVGSPLATFVGQHQGWRATYLAVAVVGAPWARWVGPSGSAPAGECCPPCGRASS
jgi:DHA1 family inner membrane transport protein